MRFLLPAVLLCLLFSCKSSNTPLIGDPSLLPTLQFSVNVANDTTLRTPGGAVIQIPAGALQADGTGPVMLEIREALTLQQMLMAGLVTSSNGEALSSGGMIYINAAAGRSVRITRPIKVALPAANLQKEMQLYKGVEETDGSVNWTDPQPLPANPQIAAYDRGRALFQQKCSSCHSIGKEGTGPDLAHLLKRFPVESANTNIYYNHFREPDTIQAADIVREENFYKDTSNSKHDEDRLVQLRDHYPAAVAYKCNLQAQYASSGPEIQQLLPVSDSAGEMNDYAAVIRYIQTESDRLSLPLPRQEQLRRSADSCASYQQEINRLTQSIDQVKATRKNLQADNGNLVERIPDPTWGGGTTLPAIDDLVSPQNINASYYQFTIETFGWYNIDMLVKMVKGVEESQLTVRLQGSYKSKATVYLAIPSLNILGEAGPSAADPDWLAFFKNDGSIPLPQEAQAYIIGMAESAESAYFGIQRFTTSTSQQLELELKAGTKQEFEAAIKALPLKDLQITLSDTKNAGAIRHADTTLQQLEQALQKTQRLKPVGIDCNCQASPISGKPTASYK